MRLMKSWIVIACLLVAVSCSPRDSALTATVKAKLVADTTVRASSIEVSTRDRVVTLTGNLDDQAEKDRALEIARRTSGVRDVVDMIAVRTAEGRGNAPDPPRTLGQRIDDVAITAAVKSRLLDDPDVKGSRIDVDTREGVVFLTGVVESDAAKVKAVQLARETEHVKEVQANLAVRRG